KQDRIPAALDSLRLLCTLATEDRGPFDLALRALAAAGASGKAHEALLEAASGPQVNPLVGGVWARSTADAGRWAECRRGLARLPDRSRIWGEAARSAVSEIAPDSLNSYYKCLRGLLLAVLEAREESSVDRLKAAAKEMPTFWTDAALLNAYRKALGRIARARGGFRGFWTWL